MSFLRASEGSRPASARSVDSRPLERCGETVSAVRSPRACDRSLQQHLKASVAAASEVLVILADRELAGGRGGGWEEDKLGHGLASLSCLGDEMLCAQTPRRGAAAPGHRWDGPGQTKEAC